MKVYVREDGELGKSKIVIGVFDTLEIAMDSIEGKWKRHPQVTAWMCLHPFLRNEANQNEFAPNEYCVITEHEVIA